MTTVSLLSMNQAIVENVKKVKQPTDKNHSDDIILPKGEQPQLQSPFSDIEDRRNRKRE